jgi:serine/threonine protein kinase
LEGAVGTVYGTTSKVVIKFAHRKKEAWRSIVREAETYRVLGEKHISSIPIFYGIFASEHDFALILSHEGESLDDFSEMSPQQRWVVERSSIEKSHLRFDRVDLFATLKMIHKAGVKHGDFEARNVVRGLRGPIIIDFSHSNYDHDCSGPDTCEELMEARDEIWKDNSSDHTSSNRPSVLLIQIGKANGWVPSRA